MCKTPKAPRVSSATDQQKKIEYLYNPYLDGTSDASALRNGRSSLRIERNKPAGQRHPSNIRTSQPDLDATGTTRRGRPTNPSNPTRRPRPGNPFPQIGLQQSSGQRATSIIKNLMIQ